MAVIKTTEQKALPLVLQTFSAVQKRVDGREGSFPFSNLLLTSPVGQKRVTKHCGPSPSTFEELYHQLKWEELQVLGEQQPEVVVSALLTLKRHGVFNSSSCAS